MGHAADGQAQALDDCPKQSGLSGGIGVGAGALASFSSAGILSVADDTRDYSFLASAGIAAGVTGGLGILYAVIDQSSNCSMTNGSFSWSVPIVLFAVGAALPLAIWGAAEKNGPATSSDSAKLSLPVVWRF